MAIWDLVAGTVPVALLAIAYYGKRYIEGKPALERLSRLDLLLKINAQRLDQGLTTDEVRALESESRGTWTFPRFRRAKAALKIGSPRRERNVTQIDLNRISHEAFEVAALAMRQGLDRLRDMLQNQEDSAESVAELEASQVAWAVYSKRQCELAGGFYRGGTIVPLIQNSEAAALANARAKELNDLYEQSRRG